MVENRERGWHRHSPTVARLGLAWNWCAWFLLTLLLFFQVFAVIWPTVETQVHVVFGQEPSLGRYEIPGTNDDPLTDRCIVCMRKGRQYVPAQLSQALVDQRNRPISIDNLTTNGIDGYRVIPRERLKFDTTRLKIYTPACSILAEKIARIIDVCSSLGYENVTRDVLRVIDGTHGDTVTILPNTLPVLLMPYWDYAPAMRLAVPSTDGSACLLRMGFGYVSSDGRDLSTTLSATPRRNRETTTAQWLGVTDGKWRNGWLEVPTDGSRWYSDLTSADPRKPYDLPWYDFDLESETAWIRGKACSQEVSPCEESLSMSSWAQLTILLTTFRVTSLTISNGARSGFFLFETDGKHIIKSSYTLEKFVSNITLAGLSLQWLIAMLALHKRGETIGVGALANALSFKLLPVLLLPRLKSTLEGFWTAGCRFEGEQMALSESWSVIYPAIGEFVLVYFSLLNTIAKLTQRRISDALFGPTLLLFALMHYVRYDIASSDMFGFDGRVATVVTAAEVEDASLISYLTTDLAFRLNGRVVSLFAIKILVLLINLAPLVVGLRVVSEHKRRTHVGGVVPVATPEGERENGLEAALAIRFDTNGGLGLPSVYCPHPQAHSSSREAVVVVPPYDIVRAGYIVVGFLAGTELSEHGRGDGPRLLPPMIMVSVNSWCSLLAMVPVSGCVSVYLMPRVLAFPVSAGPSGLLRVEPEPRLCRLGDGFLKHLHIGRISTWPTI